MHNFRQVVSRTTCVRRTVTPSQMVNGMYSTEYLATHTVAGGNQAKKVMDAEVLHTIIGNSTRRQLNVLIYRQFS